MLTSIATQDALAKFISSGAYLGHVRRMTRIYKGRRDRMLQALSAEAGNRLTIETPAGGVHLHVLAFDLTRCADGHWWVVGQRTQAPSGLGYILENRLIIAQQFPEAFRQMAVQRLAADH